MLFLVLIYFSVFNIRVLVSVNTGSKELSFFDSNSMIF